MHLAFYMFPTLNVEGHKSSGGPHCRGLACVPVPEINLLSTREQRVLGGVVRLNGRSEVHRAYVRVELP